METQGPPPLGSTGGILVFFRAKQHHKPTWAKTEPPPDGLLSQGELGAAVQGRWAASGTGRAACATRADGEHHATGLHAQGRGALLGPGPQRSSRQGVCSTKRLRRWVTALHPFAAAG